MMSARPLDVSVLSGVAASDDASIVIRKRREFEEAMEQHARHLQETVEAKERRIGELSAFVERLVADYKYNLAIIDELQAAADDHDEQLRAMQQQALRAEDDAAQHRAARTLLDAELRETRRTAQKAAAGHDAEVDELQRKLSHLQSTFEAEARRWEREHQAALDHVHADWRRRLEEDHAQRVRDAEANAAAMAALRGQHQETVAKLNARVAELEMLARHHAGRSETLAVDLNQSRSLADEDRARAEDMHAATVERLRQTETQRQELHRRLLERESELATAEERFHSSLRQEAAKATDMELSIAAERSAAHTAKMQLDSARREAAEHFEQLRNVSADWERRYTSETRAAVEKARAFEVKAKQLESDAEVTEQQLREARTRVVELQRDLDGTKEQLQQARSTVRDRDGALETTRQRLEEAEQRHRELLKAHQLKDVESREAIRQLQEETQRLTADVQRLGRERVTLLTKAGEDVSELRRQLSASEAAREELTSTVADMRRHNLPAAVAELREDQMRLRHDLASAVDERDALRENIRRITAEFQSGHMPDLEAAKARQIDELHRQLQRERIDREALEVALREARQALRDAEDAHREANRRRFGSDSGAVTAKGGAASSSRHYHRRVEWGDDAAGQSDGGSDSGGGEPRRHGSRGSSRPASAVATTSTVARLRHEVEEYKDQCQRLKRDLADCEKARAAAVVQVEVLSHKLGLLGREREELASLNAKLRHESLRLHGQLEGLRHATSLRAHLPPPHRRYHPVKAPLRRRRCW
jgi:chromosome segregation ATPase